MLRISSICKITGCGSYTDDKCPSVKALELCLKQNEPRSAINAMFLEEDLVHLVYKISNFEIF